MTYPRATVPTPVAVSPTLAEGAAWDVRDTVVLGVQVTVTGAEPVTVVVVARIDDSFDWGPSPLTINTPANDGAGVLQPGETGRVDIDAGANLEVGLFFSCPTVASSVLVGGRTDGGKRR